MEEKQKSKEEQAEEKKEGKASPLFVKLLSACILLLLAGCLAMMAYLYQETIKERDLWNQSVRAARIAEAREAGEEQAESHAAVPFDMASFYQKLHDGEDVRVLVLGDVYATGAGASSEEKGWPQLFAAGLRDEYGAACTVLNLSLGGGNTAYSGYVQLQNLPDEEAPDLCIVSFGYYDDIFTYNLFYEALLRALKARFPGTDLVSVIESAAVTDLEGNADETAMYTRRLCEHYHGIVANMAEAYADAARPYAELTGAYGMPNDTGQKVQADWLLSCIRPEVEAYREKDTEEVEALDKEADAFSKYTYVPAERFQRVDDFNYRIRLNGLKKLGAGTSSLLGLDYDYLPGRNNVNVSIDREIFAGHVSEFEGSAPERHILVLGNHAVVSDDLIIGFEDSAQAEAFHGLVLSGDISLKENEEKAEVLPLPPEEETAESTEA